MRPMTLTSAALIVIVLALLKPALDLGAAASMLPVAMLASLVMLSIFAIIGDQKKACEESKTEPLLSSPKRVYSALFSVFLFIVSVHLFGFYPSTALFVPTIAYVFGCRDARALAIATVIVTGLIYAVFSFAMAKEFPVGIVWGA